MKTVTEYTTVKNLIRKIYKTTYNSPLGLLILESDGVCLTGLRPGDDVIHDDCIEIFTETKNWLDKYFSNKKPNISELKLKPDGTSFRQVVWDILCSIPYGTTISYGEVADITAKKLNKTKMSARAVGNAIGHNPIMIIIPCHRVIGKNGKLTGYAWGLDLKAKLLELEKNV